MRRVGPTSSRLVVAFVAALAIVVMHGGGASAHACADLAGPTGHAAMSPGPAEHASDHAGRSGHEDHRHDPGGGQSSHCTVSACSAIVVAPAASPGGPRLVGAHVLGHVDGGVRSPACGPEPPVPRSFPNA